MTSPTLKIRHGTAVGLSLVLTAGYLAGCGGVVAVSSGGGGGKTQPQNGGNAGGVAEDEIGLRFLNDSNVDVDTQFYATNDVLDDPSEDLFQPQYRIQSSIGVAGTGIVEADDDDEITFPCTGSTIVGTEGGEFLDPDRGTLLATGQPRLLRIDENFDCGNTVIFAYTGTSEEDYTTLPPVVDSR